MFSDLYVGVLLPQDLDKDTVNGFRDILKELTELREQTVTRELSHEEQNRLGQKIAGFLIKGRLVRSNLFSNLVCHIHFICDHLKTNLDTLKKRNVHFSGIISEHSVKSKWKIM